MHGGVLGGQGKSIHSQQVEFARLAGVEPRRFCPCERRGEVVIVECRRDGVMMMMMVLVGSAETVVWGCIVRSRAWRGGDVWCGGSWARR
jgi:hypothetical protein